MDLKTTTISSGCAANVVGKVKYSEDADFKNEAIVTNKKLHVRLKEEKCVSRTA